MRVSAEARNKRLDAIEGALSAHHRTKWPVFYALALESPLREGPVGLGEGFEDCKPPSLTEQDLLDYNHGRKPFILFRVLVLPDWVWDEDPQHFWDIAAVAAQLGVKYQVASRWGGPGPNPFSEKPVLAPLGGCPDDWPAWLKFNDELTALGRRFGALV